MCAQRLALLQCPGSVDVDISWYGAAHGLSQVRASESTVQALSGLMHIHGRDLGRPRRLGLEVGCVIAGHLAAQAVLAAHVAQRRQGRTLRMSTSVLDADLLLLSHHIAAATTGRGPAAIDNGGPGPPFMSSDGVWFEIETLDATSWRSFWSALGADGPYLEPSWRSFRRRFGTATCSLSPALHATTASRTLQELATAAVAHRVSLTPLRRCTDALREPGLAVVGPSIRRHADAYEAVPAQSPTGGSQLPLAGIHIVEATNRIQGPLAGLLLQKLGAEVVRVEPLAGNVSVIDATLNRGKRHVALHLSTRAGRADLLDLIAHADVFLHNWRPGKAREWGLDAADTVAVNRRLIFAAASAWGDARSPAQLVGTDFMVQAYAGIGDTVNPMDEPPFPTRLPVSDVMGAVLAAEGVLGALNSRELSGGAWRVDSSLLGGAMGVQAHVLESLARGEELGRSAGRPLWRLLDRPLETADGFLVVDAVDAADVALVCAACDVAPNLDHPTAEARVAEGLRAEPAGLWVERLTSAGVAASVVRVDLASLATDVRLHPLLEPLPEGGVAPASPWRIERSA